MLLKNLEKAYALFEVPLRTVGEYYLDHPETTR